MSGTVYLLHLDATIGDPDNPRGQATHYIGWTNGPRSRVAERCATHAAGRGARMLAFCARNRIGWTVARTWYAPRWYERKLKARKDAAFFCPICAGKRARRRARLVVALKGGKR